MEIEVQVEETVMNLEAEDKEEEWEVLVLTRRWASPQLRKWTGPAPGPHQYLPLMEPAPIPSLLQREEVKLTPETKSVGTQPTTEGRWNG